MPKQNTKGRAVRVTRKEGGFPVRFPHSAGIDIGSGAHFVAAPPHADGSANVRSFGTTTGALVEMADWLLEQGVKSVAMESTGVYWIPAFEVLEARGLEVILVDARQMKHVPGRKTDVIDCQWLQMLHACGLLRGAFRPPDDHCRVRSLMRQKGIMVRQQADWIRRMQKCLDQMNIRVHRAVTDISGHTGMAIIRAIVSGERDPVKLARLRDARCQKDEAQMAEELRGTWKAEHLFNLVEALHMYDVCQQSLARYNEELARAIGELQQTAQVFPDLPDPRKQKRLEQQGEEDRRQSVARALGHDVTRVGGCSVETAEMVLAEMGAGISRFPSERHFVSYVCLSPGLEISGGKPVRRRSRGSTSSRLGQAFRMAALAVRNSKTALGAYYRRISRRKGANVAVFATARKIAVSIYRMLRYGVDYIDPGEDAYNERFKAARIQLATQIANQFGYKMIKNEAAA
jgi:transposase